MRDAPDVPNLNSLVELGRRDGVDIRPTLLRVMTDLYVQKAKHSEQEDQQFTELALRLFDLVDTQTRATVAGKIAACPTAPAEVRRHVLKDQSQSVATPAERPPTGLFSGATAAASELNELFFSAEAEERRLILLNLAYAPLMPATPMNAAAARDTIQRLEAAALGHHGEVFIRELERALSISREHARRLMEDASGEPVVVVAVALGMPADVLQRILLCLKPAISESIRRIHELALLHEDMETDSALRLIAVWQAGYPLEKKSPDTAPTHQSHPRRDERRDAPVQTARPKIRWDDYEQPRKTDSA